MFPSYIQSPTNCNFEGQDPDEKILLLLRAHPITNLSWIFPSFILLFMPFLLPPLTSFLGINLSFLPATYGIVFLIINYLLVLIIAYEGFLYWYFNVYVVTDKNIIDVDFHSILFKNIDRAPLSNIEDVSSTMSGMLHSFFHYGNVFVQTAGTNRNIDFISVPHPDQVADFILDESQKRKGGHHAPHP